MKITFLGTSSGIPTKDRNVTSIILENEGGKEVYLIDCGEGTQQQFQKCPVKVSKISKIFITHLHGDHCFGLPGLLCSMSMGGGTSGEGMQDVEIYGPIGIRKFILNSLDLSDSHLAFKLKINEIIPPEMKEDEIKNQSCDKKINPEVEVKGGFIKWNEKAKEYLLINDKKKQLIVKAGPLKHRVFCVGYVFKELDKVGTLDVAKLKQLGVKPGKDYGLLKSGKDITLENGTIIKSKDVVGEDIKGRKIVILGDTYDSSGISTIAQDCDLMTHESTLENDEEKKCVANGHSTPKMAATFAKSINCKRLILTHYSARYAPSVIEKMDTRISITLLLKQAKEIFENVELGEDFKSFEVKVKK